MNESEIIECADTLKKITNFYGGADHYLDMRKYYWSVGSHWIDFGYMENLSDSKHFPLVWTVDSPDCYVQMEKITIANVEVGRVEYLCIFDNELRRQL